MAEDAIVAALLFENATSCIPPLSESEVRTIAVSAAEYPPADRRLPENFEEMMISDLTRRLS
jgi:hypothetical protein